MKTPSRPMRIVASVLAFALLHASFSEQAFAQVVRVAVSAPVGGSAAAAAAGLSSPAGAAMPAPSFSNAGLAGSPSVPSITLSPRMSGSAVVMAAASAVTPSALAPRFAVGFSPTALTPAAAAASKNDAAEGSASPAREAAPMALVSGPRTGRAASKAAAIISGARAFFGGKSIQSVPAESEILVPGRLSAAHASDLDPSIGGDGSVTPQAGVADEPPTPEPTKGSVSKSKGWFGLGAIVASLIGGMLVMQLGLEAQGAAMSQLTEDSFGDFSILAQVAIFASIGSMVGQQLAQFFSGKFGLTKTFYGANILRAASLGTMIFLLGTGHMALPLMFVFYAINGVVTGIAVTAEGTLRKFLLIQQGVSQQKFRTWWQLSAEILAVPAPMILGGLVLSVGASWITALYPATIVIALLLFLMLKVLPLGAAKRIENMVEDAGGTAKAAKKDPNAPKVGAWRSIKDAVKNIFNNMEEGKDFVFKSGFLLYSFAGALTYDLMNTIIYRLIAPGYGKFVAGSAGMSAVQGNLVGMFSLGGLLLAVTFVVLEGRAKKRDAYKTPAELLASERASMMFWMMLGIPALLLLGVMAFKIVLPFAPLMFMGVNWMPSSALALMLIPFGYVQVAASIKLNSYFQDRLPADSAKVQKALAFSGSAMTALSIVLMLALKPLFGDIAAFNPFPYLAGALIPLGAAVFFLRRKLANATKPENIKPIADAVEKAAGGFVGVLLGVIAAALLLSALPFIPGVAGLLAGLGILGKFALHLATALALPVAGWFADRAIRRRAK